MKSVARAIVCAAWVAASVALTFAGHHNGDAGWLMFFGVIVGGMAVV